jgi:hypothetical protein
MFQRCDNPLTWKDSSVGVYVSVRGWLECDQKQLDAVQAIITSRDDNHYTGGWGLPPGSFQDR